MSSIVKVSNVKGTRDIPPSEMIIREEVTGRIKKVFQSYGFVPLQTPALENFETLSAKGAGGEEIKKETYNFKIAGRQLALKFDQTVPLARFVAMNPQLRMPFKRYQYDRSWRYGEVLNERGRYREFEQFDIDTVGSESMICDSEIVAAITDCFRNLGIKNFKVYYNNRKLLNSILEYLKIPKTKWQKTLTIIDKLDKKSEREVREELVREKVNEKILEKIKSSVSELSAELKNCEGIKELKEFEKYLKDFGVNEAVFQASLARGLDYYTGTIFEVKIPGFRSLAGGGRYDNMIGMFAGKKIPAVGAALGIDAIIDAMKKSGLAEEKKSTAEYYIIPVDTESVESAIKLSVELRKNGSVELGVPGKSVKASMKFADRQGIENAVIIGREEIEKGEVTIKNLKNGSQKSFTLHKQA